MDQLISETLLTEVGRNAFPSLAQQVKTTADVQQLVTNVAATIKSTGRHNKIQLIESITRGVSGIYCDEILGINKSQRKRAAAKQSDGVQSASLFTSNYKSGVQRKKRTVHEEGITMAFFIDTTSQNSGCQTNTRNLEIQKHEWEAEWNARYTKYLREAVYLNPHLATDHQGDKGRETLTKFQASCRAAKWTEQQPNFDPAEEYKNRYAAFMEEYLTDLGRKNGHVAKKEPITDEQRKEKKLFEKDTLRIATFDPSKYEIKVPAFWKVLEYIGDKKCRYTTFVYPHPCPLCLNGPTDEVVLKHLLDKASALKLVNEMIPNELEGRIRALDEKSRI